MNEPATRQRTLLRTAEFDRLCKANDLNTGRQVCEAMNISPAQLHKVRKGQIQPGPKFIYNALDLFKVPYVTLFERVDEPVPTEQAVA